MRVLIAEDDAVSRRILQRTLERFGHECEVTTNGAEAWQAYQDAPFDVVITDWVMPQLDGVELCSMIRANPGACYTYVILLSVLNDRGHFLKGMQAGADDYLAKPLDPEEMQARLAAAERVTTLHRQLANQNARLETLLHEQEQLSATLAETAEARGRLEGVTLAAREIVHLLSNDLALAVGAIELMRLQSELTPSALVLLRQVEAGMAAAERHLRSLQKVVRVRTKETPIGPALDLARSTLPCN
ncbi:MAG: response regulator [Chloroflexi bacterium]|nr:response regulator [Chloroflexota bacterium]